MKSLFDGILTSDDTLGCQYMVRWKISAFMAGVQQLYVHTSQSTKLSHVTSVCLPDCWILLALMHASVVIETQQNLCPITSQHRSASRG
jgi:hypothetical protein